MCNGPLSPLATYLGVGLWLLARRCRVSEISDCTPMFQLSINASGADGGYDSEAQARKDYHSYSWIFVMHTQICSPNVACAECAVCVWPWMTYM